MFAFNLKRSNLDKFDDYRKSRIQNQFIRGLTDKNFGNYFAQSLNPYTIKTTENIKFVPMNAFLEALMSAKAVFSNMNFTINTVTNEVDNNHSDDDDDKAEPNVTRQTHDDDTDIMLCRGCNEYNDCTAEDCEFLYILEEKDSRIRTVLNRNISEAEKNDHIDRINQNYDRILNKVIRKYNYDPNSNQEVIPLSNHSVDDNDEQNHSVARSSNQHENNNHNSYNYNYNNRNNNNDDNYDDNYDDYQSAVENDYTNFENEEYSEDHQNNSQNDMEQDNRVVRFTNNNEDVHRTICLTKDK
jgi:hypothetical protein